MISTTTAHTAMSAIGGNIITKNSAINIPIMVMEPAFRTFISPMTGKMENCSPSPSCMMPNTGTWMRSGIMALVTSVHAVMMARNTMSLIL